MTKDELKSFSLKVAQSSKSELVVTTYDIILNYIQSAQEAYESGNKKDFVYNLKKVMEFLKELISALDYHYAVSYDLMSLYLFLNKCLIEAVVTLKNDKLDRLAKIIINLKRGFEEVSKVDKSGPVMKNRGQVYAGLTYGKGNLTEVFIPNDQLNFSEMK